MVTCHIACDLRTCCRVSHGLSYYDLSCASDIVAIKTLQRLNRALYGLTGLLAASSTCCTHMLASAWRAIQHKHKAAAPVRCISCHSRSEEEPLDRLALLGEAPYSAALS